MPPANPLFSNDGDPNGTRTRVFAVDPCRRLKSTPVPAFHDLFYAFDSSVLQAKGDFSTPAMAA